MEDPFKNISTPIPNRKYNNLYSFIVVFIVYPGLGKQNSGTYFSFLVIFAKFQSKNKRGTFSCCHYKYFSEYSVFLKISQKCCAFFSKSEFCLLPNLAKKSLDILSLLNKLSVFQDVVIILKCGPDILKFSQYFERLYLVNIFNSVPIWKFYNWPIFQMISLLESQLIL